MSKKFREYNTACDHDFVLYADLTGRRCKKCGWVDINYNREKVTKKNKDGTTSRSRKTSLLPTRNWAFGLRRVHDASYDPAEQRVMDNQFWLSFRTYQHLVQVEREARVAQKELQYEFDPAVADVDDRLTPILIEQERIAALIKAKRVLDKDADVKAENALMKAEKDKAKELGAERRALTDAFKEDPEYVAGRKRIAFNKKNGFRNVDIAADRAGLHTGSRGGVVLRVKQAASAARSGLLRANGNYIPRTRRPAFPSFYGDRDSIRIQFTGGGLTRAELFSGRSSHLKIDPVDDAHYADVGHMKKCEKKARRRAQRAKVTFCAERDEKLKPKYVTFLTTLHRRIPTDAVIKEARVTRTRYLNDFKYELILTMESATFFPDAPLHKRAKAVAIDLGWRYMGAGIYRVAYWMDTNGNHGPIEVPRFFMDGLSSYSERQSQRQQVFNDIKKKLLAWRESSTDSWFLHETEQMPKWKKYERLHVLFKRWSKNRAAGDEEMFDLLQAWYREDQRTARREIDVRTRAQRARKDYYLCLAKWMATSYDLVIFEDVELTSLRRAPKVENAPATHGSTQRENASLCAPGMLRDLTKLAVEKYGSRYIEVNAAFTTKTCHVCRKVETWEHKSELVHTCGHCGATWDRDYNGSSNILQRGIDAANAPPPPPKEEKVEVEADADDE